MTSPDDARLAIRFEHVSKIYRLYGSRKEQVLDNIGLPKFLRPRQTAKHGEFHALRDVSFEIRRGERIGVIGRNGAGKTTMLRLITQNFAPTRGRVEIDGSVQALLQLGLGFHTEFTGYENIVASLNYNGLVGAAFDEALQEVVDFVELGDFLHQPVKAYSMGMQARLQFAAATAIRPDILIVDEVLGAGDAYFSAKSAHRMKKLATSGCTLLLVSHATAEILRFCERVIWMHQGSILMDGPALDVVRVYEAYIEELNFKMRKQTEALWADVDAAALKAVPPALSDAPEPAPVAAAPEPLPLDIAPEPHDDAPGDPPEDEALESEGLTLPGWQQEMFASMLDEDHENNVDGLDRWPGERGLKINHVRILNEKGKLTDRITSGNPFTIEVGIRAEDCDRFRFRMSLLFMTTAGIGVTRNFSPYYEHDLRKDEIVRLRLFVPACQLTGGEYIFSCALFKHFDMVDSGTAIRYDLLSRAFRIRIDGRLGHDPGLFHQEGEWAALASADSKVILLQQAS
ncbi:MAG: ABC transporter ATP-binding protein [Hyphomonas sp.]|uniref:ABC transporter ATP-binding protein n=1 Tax=Hyphomonas sp. TaxID=87 RepID=UPI00183DE858|nr:ABC transporter ATP-binding protein [Hyphomonas sp.]MBA3067816.1 ABC transporter ATP-binding protein [Hyphomonas sp.]MBU3919884.1 ABC transporter ATP-binding protein [Alphaproteobacteria bacterium]MBU4063898.1 ABC transporter ATP-binding protein [Alphaproteobacteria bacterium]MBU4163304.1 ABC transporter ATP-binding protein [Alphaproteobacteria bacterium]